jgi:hypothetical protein
MEAAALELGLLMAATTADMTAAAGAEGAGAAGPAAAAAGSRQAAAGKAGEKLAAWPLDLGAEFEYEAAVRVD